MRNAVAIKFCVLKWIFPVLFLLSIDIFGQDLSAKQKLSPEQTIIKLQGEIEQTANDSVKVYLLISLSKEIRKTDKFTIEDISIASKAVDEGLKSGDIDLYARALDNLGLIYRYHLQYELSIPLHEKAYSLIENLPGKVEAKMRYLNNAGVAARNNFDFEKAVSYFHTSLILAEETQSLRNLEIASNNLGIIYFSIPGQQEQGLRYFEMALKTAKETGNKRGMAINYLSLSQIFEKRKDFKESREYIAKLEKLNREMDNQLGIGLSYQSYGNSYLAECENLNLAQDYLLKALEQFEQIKNLPAQAEVKYDLGKLHFEQKEYAKTKEYALQAFYLAKSIKNNELSSRCSELLYQMHNAQHQYKDALYYLNLWRDYQDSLNLMEQQIKVLALDKKMNLERKETEISLLMNQQEFQESRLASQQAKLRNRNIILLLALALIAALGGGFILRSTNEKIKKEQIILEREVENERLEQAYNQSMMEAEVISARMQINPHFLFNSLNSIKLLIQQEKPKAAISYLVQLSRFNRALLETGNSLVHTVNEELEFARQYLELEKNRFKDDFHYEINNDVKQKSLERLIPPMFLQPYIENAIWHGLLPSEKEKKMLVISTYEEEDVFIISIDDNGIGRSLVPQKNKPSSGKGMLLNKRRMELFNETTGDEMSIRVFDKTDEENESLGTRIIIYLKCKQ